MKLIFSQTRINVFSTTFFLLFIPVITFAQNNSADKKLFVQDSLHLISDQFKFTEGPAVDAKGNIFFTDQPNNKIWKYDTNGALAVFMNESGRSNGLYFDHKGNLFACADEHNQIWCISTKGKVKVLLSDVEGKHFNGPNDLWVDPQDGIYFTDPYYQRDYWTRTAPEIKGDKVYYLAKGKKAAVVATDQLIKPNGIVGSPDGKFLYVADIGAGKTYQFKINADGSLSDQQMIISKGSDGMTLDSEGNIYLTGKGVTIYNNKGTQIGHIDVPESWTANVCFGGKNRDQLFITASKSVYTLPMQVHGVE
ncbi:MAG: SMP-30/gluconolactonase/LRE family protein [Ferruginibacter sp.]